MAFSLGIHIDRSSLSLACFEVASRSTLLRGIVCLSLACFEVEFNIEVPESVSVLVLLVLKPISWLW